MLTLLAAALCAPASAHAAPQLDVKLTRDTVRYGAAHRLSGTLKDGDAPLSGQQIVLEGRRYPYEGSYRVIERVTTDARGRFAFKPKLDRNHRLRVSAPAQGMTSAVLNAFTLPSIELSFRALRPGVVRLYQRYTVPSAVKLTSPTLFYVGPRRAKRASIRRSGKLVRVRPGHFTSHADVTLPAAWKGAFRYASCFRASPGSGMGDPKDKCATLRLEF